MELIKSLKEKLNQPLPGKAAQYKMAHVVRQSYPPSSKEVRSAGVLALLYQKKGDWHLPLIIRQSSNPNDRHKGQISFPGGKYEEEDTDLSYTALREANEEVGILPDDVQVLGQLTDLYIPVSNFRVFPFVGSIDYEPDFVLQESEVRGLLEVPLAALLDPKTIQLTNLKIGNNITLKEVPYYDIQGHIIWGATAMMLSELLTVIDLD